MRCLPRSVNLIPHRKQRTSVFSAKNFFPCPLQPDSTVSTKLSANRFHPGFRQPMAKNKNHNTQPQRRGKPAVRPGNYADIVYGLHSVRAALENPKRVFNTVYATKNAAAKLQTLFADRNIFAQIVLPRELDKLVGPDAVHQGVVARLAPLAQLDITDVDPEGIVVLLDQITDPHNVGAILRSCAAFNVQAMITTGRNSPQGSAIVGKTASGGQEHVPIIEVTNLSRAMDHLKKLNFTLIGLDSEADNTIGGLNIPAPLALVLGAEGKGLRHKTRQNVDIMARLDMPGAIKSLNVSNAAAVCLYALQEEISSD